MAYLGARRLDDLFRGLRQRFMLVFHRLGPGVGGYIIHC